MYHIFYKFVVESEISSAVREKLELLKKADCSADCSGAFRADFAKKECVTKWKESLDNQRYYVAHLLFLSSHPNITGYLFYFILLIVQNKIK